ncbi:GAF domain-containing sensor histidine kinase [Aequorivita lipolytica]|uniref:histidine kinase n=1 Tax=Aequorivita lipolytica TaxID=153267 RepID=A0A5C6YKI9_9FLAO|nr:GAF domain-containing sensor histidine kinase [Aequorivita lipolytica]TXD67881.1 GAF domain-containing sensor histidine kinase [Aequorivita lipolytica]SRX53835.1 Phytochrome-like protein cph1 [Aequorivita lipolytica]
MIAPEFPVDEQQRLTAVHSYHLLDTLPEKDFDNITSLTANICEVPISLVTLLDADRNFLKSHYGVPFNESPRNISFCGHAILDEADIFIVEDARTDSRFKDNPLVKDMNAIFYAGVRLINSDGYPLGTLCVFDTKPRTLNKSQKKALVGMAYQVVNLFEARKRNRTLLFVQQELKDRNEELKNFAGVVSHDMKMPLANMIITSDMLRTKYGNLLDVQGREYLDYIKQSSFTLSEYITGLLEHYESDKTASLNDEIFDSHDLLEEIIELLNINIDCEINLPEENMEMQTNKVALEQIVLNLVGNSLKYNDKKKIKIDIECSEEGGFYLFSIADNGMGIAKNNIEHIFELFATTGKLDRYGKKGNGIGLSTVKKLITKLGGEIEVFSELGKGTTFKFSIKKN